MHLVLDFFFCRYICIHSMCVFNHRYITYRKLKLSLYQKTLWYLLVGPNTLLKALILDLSNYLTALSIFQKTRGLSCFDCGGEWEME